MFSVLLPIAEATGHAVEAASAHAESANAITQIFDTFGIKPELLLAQIVNFSIVAFLLWRFAFKPVVATIEDRQKQIESGLKYAADMRAKLEQAQFESQHIIQKAQDEAAKIVEETRKSAKEFGDREQKAATDRANELIAKAQQVIELERKKMFDEARGEIARLVVATTQRVLAKELSDADRNRYNESAARELTGV